MPPHVRIPVFAALLISVACIAIVSGCGGGGQMTPGSTQSSGTAGAITIAAQSIPVVDAAGKPTGRTVSTPAVTAQAGQQFTLPVRIDNSSDVSGVQLRLSVASSALSVVDAANGSIVPAASEPLVVKNISSDQHTASVAVAAASGASSAGSGELVIFTLKAAAGAAGGQQTVNLSGALADARGYSLGGINPSPTVATAATSAVRPQATGLVGDLMGTGKAEVGSAIKILRVVVGLDTAPTDITLWDCNGSGVIDVGDAIVILRCIVGLSSWPIVVPTTADVTGKVVDYYSGLAVSGAVAAMGGKTAATGSDGKFTLASVPKGTQTLVVTKTGYSTYTQANIAVSPGSLDLGNIVFKPTVVPTTGTIAGQLFMPDGTTPVVGATVSVSGQIGLVAITDATGSFTIRGVPAGTQALTATNIVSSTGDDFSAGGRVTVIANQTVTIKLIAYNGPPPPPL